MINLRPIPNLKDTSQTELNRLVFDINDRLQQLTPTVKGQGKTLAGAITADQANIATSVQLGSGSYFEGSAIQALTITGFMAGDDGQLVIFKNTSSYTYTLAYESTADPAPNRIKTRSASDYSLAANGAVLLEYLGVQQRWYVVSAVV